MIRSHALSARLDPIASVIQRLVSVVRANPKTIVFAEGEEEKTQMEDARGQLIMFYHAALQLLAQHKIRARVTFYVAFMHACLRTDRLDLAAEVLALRRANTLQIFQLFKKHQDTVDKWERKIDRELNKRFYFNRNLV